MSLRWVGRLSLLLLTHGLCVCLGYFLVMRRQSRVVLIVNGDMITRRELDGALSVYREEAIQQIAAQHIVAQAAKRQNIMLSDKDLNLSSLAKLDPDLREGKAEMIKTEALFRKLILADFTDADRHKAYEAFKDELAQYEFSSFLVSEGTDYRRLNEDLSRKGSTFESLEKAYRKARSADALPDSLRLEHLRVLVGPAGCQKVLQMKVGETIGPVPSAVGPLILRLDKVKDSYAELEPSISEMLHKSRVRFYQYHLGMDSAVTSLLPTDRGERPKDKGTPDFRLPQPSASATPKLEILPSPKPDSEGIRNLLPPSHATPRPSFLPKPRPRSEEVPTLPSLTSTPTPTPK